MTFASRSQLEKKSGRVGGSSRFEYLQALVTEFQDTHKKGEQK